MNLIKSIKIELRNGKVFEEKLTEENRGYKINCLLNHFQNVQNHSIDGYCNNWNSENYKNQQNGTDTMRQILVIRKGDVVDSENLDIADTNITVTDDSDKFFINRLVGKNTDGLTLNKIELINLLVDSYPVELELQSKARHTIKSLIGI